MSSEKQTVLVTGGAGYIGSHAVLALKESGYNVVILDNLVYGHRDIVENVLKVELIVGDTTDRELLDRLFAERDICAVMHFAAYIAVGESVAEPGKYYQNNVHGTLTLLEAMIAADIKRFVFSSTCAIYGVPKEIPLIETHPKTPLSPYASSKLMVEQILADFDIAYGLKSSIFRYFNASGAHPNAQLGEDHSPETHLIPLVLQAAMGRRDNIAIFGTDYDTPDGTCIRDYIHVCDLASAHVLGLEYLINGGETEAFNLGNGNGFSVREAIEVAKRVTNCEIAVVEKERRPGDATVLLGSAEKAKKLLGWNPKYPELSDIIAHAWQWHQVRHGDA
ncbi:MAG: UDP-glucose 4-epimerase GalE [Geitlerinemataceae cyanobacterium]